jgi:hypothetical protein
VLPEHGESSAQFGAGGRRDSVEAHPRRIADDDIEPAGGRGVSEMGGERERKDADGDGATVSAKRTTSDAELLEPTTGRGRRRMPLAEQIPRAHGGE